MKLKGSTSIICVLYCLCLFFCSIYSEKALATASEVVIGGAVSEVEGSGTSWTIYAGHSGTDCSAGAAYYSTCNNCTSADLKACNTKYVPDSGRLQVTFKAEADGTLFARKASDGQGITLDAPGSYVKGSTVTVSVQWSSICNIALSGVCSTLTSATGNIEVGVGNINDRTNAISIAVNWEAVDSTSDSTSTVCTSTVPVATDVGACNFKMFPGDEKAYIDFVLPSGAFPSRVSTGLAYKAVRFLYYQSTNTTCADTSIKANSLYTDIPIEAGGATLTTDHINGLSNERTYCFKIASVDKADNAFFYTPDSGTFPDDHKVRPSEVIGLLTKSLNCFIATAAYGSPMDKHVQTFRNFRDQFLMNSSMGRKFIKWYYAHSPAWAQAIENDELARATVRAALWPLWILSLILLFLTPKGTAWVIGLGLILFLSYRYRLSVQTLLVSGKKKNNEKGSGKKWLWILIPLFFLSFSKTHAATSTLKRLPSQVNEEEEGEPLTTDPESTGLRGEMQKQKEDLHLNNQKIDTLKSQIETLEEEQRRKRMNLSNTQEILRKKESEKLKSLNQSSGKNYLKPREKYYPRIQSPQNYAASIRIGQYYKPDLQNPETHVTFSQIYTKASPLIFLVDFEWQMLKNIGKLGLKFGTGLYTAQGQGQFRDSTAANGQPAREKYTFIMLPNNLSAIYRMEYFNKQPLVPFVEAGGGYYTFGEIRDDGKRPKAAGAAVAQWAAGASILMDFLAPATLGEIDSDYGVNHIWFTGEFRSVIGLNTDYDFTNDIVSAGFLFEF